MSELELIMMVIRDGIVNGNSKYMAVDTQDDGLVLTDKDGHKTVINITMFLR